MNTSASSRKLYDTVIVGGGIVGIATARHLLQRHPDQRIVLLEKEARLAGHQTGRNSGVIHAGVYYQPGSLKARFCREGNVATMAFCRRHGIPYEQCGKLLVATDRREYRWMRQLFERARLNQIEVAWLDRGQLNEIEPHITGLGGIRVPATGIVDYRRVTSAMAGEFQAGGGEIRLNTEVRDLEENDRRVRVATGTGTIEARRLIACSGLMADRLVKMLGIRPAFQIVPFRGEYFQLPPFRNRLIRHLIYPIPDPDLPFLGVHLTRMIDGSVTVGPNAVLAFKREGYRKTDVSLRDLSDMMGFVGFWKVIRAHLRSGLEEFKNSVFKRGYLQQVRKYCPAIDIRELNSYPAGVRAQAVERNGSLIHDFLFVNTPRSMHVCNAPSPAATSAIPIAAHIVDKAAERFA
jgi:L-2-hydroxyglutarate oxidase